MKPGAKQFGIIVKRLRGRELSLFDAAERSGFERQMGAYKAYRDARIMAQQQARSALLHPIGGYVND